MWQKFFGSLLGVCISFSVAATSNPSPVSVPGTTAITAQEARDLWLKQAYFVDPRSTSDWEAGRIPGALHMEMRTDRYNATTVLDFVGGDFNAPIVSYCNAEACHRSAVLARDLLSWGFTNVYYFRLGYPHWLETGSPFE